MKWALVNVLSLGTMLVVFNYSPDALNEILDAIDLYLFAAFLLGPALAAGYIEGEWKNLAVLILSGWAFLLVWLVCLCFAEACRNNGHCGSIAFTAYYSLIAAMIYPFAMGIVFGGARFLRKTLETNRDQFR